MSNSQTSKLVLMTAWDQVRAKKLRPGGVRCSSNNRFNGDQAALAFRANCGPVHRNKSPVSRSPHRR